MAKFRPSEVKLVSNLLDPDSPDSEGATELAKEIIESLDKSRGKREGYIYVGKVEDWYIAWGEFSTKLQAEKFSNGIASGNHGLIVRLEDPDIFKKRMGES
jgi:hypothetical protein